MCRYSHEGWRALYIAGAPSTYMQLAIRRGAPILLAYIDHLYSQVQSDDIVHASRTVVCNQYFSKTANSVSRLAYINIINYTLQRNDA